jgi:Toxin PAAR-like domain
MFANCSLSGMHFGMPDVCKTPSPVGPVPIPYPNTAQLPMAVPPTASLKHLISMMPAHNMATMIPTSVGDNPGVAGGVVSQVVMGPARNTLGSFKVFTGGMPATKWLSPAMQNLTNCPSGMTLVPSQFKVMIMS